MRLVIKSLYGLPSNVKRLSYVSVDGVSKLDERNIKKHQRKRFIEKKIDYYSEFSPSPLSLRQFLDFGMCFMLQCSY